MYEFLQSFHSYLAYLVLIGLAISIIVAVLGASSKRPFRDGDRKLALLGLIPTHLQWVIGVILYFVSPLGASNISGAGMKDSVSRLYFLEHPIMMIIAVILITVGYARAKRLTVDSKRFSSIYIFYGIALILILIRIPWIAWPGN